MSSRGRRVRRAVLDERDAATLTIRATRRQLAGDREFMLDLADRARATRRWSPTGVRLVKLPDGSERFE